MSRPTHVIPPTDTITAKAIEIRKYVANGLQNSKVLKSWTTLILFDHDDEQDTRDTLWMFYINVCNYLGRKVRTIKEEEE